MNAHCIHGVMHTLISSRAVRAPFIISIIIIIIIVVVFLFKKAMQFQANYRQCNAGCVHSRLRLRVCDVYGSAAAHCGVEDTKMFKHVFLTGPPGTSLHALSPDVQQLKPQLSHLALLLRLR